MGGAAPESAAAGCYLSFSQLVRDELALFMSLIFNEFPTRRIGRLEQMTFSKYRCSAYTQICFLQH